MTKPIAVKAKKSLAHDLKQLGRLWPYLKQNKAQFFFAAGLIPVITVIESSLPILLKHVVDFGVIPKDAGQLWYYALGYGLFVVLAYVVRATHSLLMAKSVYRLVTDMRRDLIAHIFRLSARFHDGYLSGAIVTRATSDFDNLSESLNQGVLSTIIDIALLLGAVIGLLVLDWRLALQAMLLVPAVMWVVGKFSDGLKKAMLEARAKISVLNAFAQEALYGHNTVKLLTAEQEASSKFKVMANEYRDAQMKSVVLDAVLFSFLDGISSVTIGIVLWLALKNFGVESGLTAGLLVAFVQYVQNLFEPLKQLGNKIAMLQGVFTSLDRIIELFQTKDFIAGDHQPPPLQGKVSFDHVSFRYQNTDVSPYVLRDISFQVDPGQSVALVGPTGSGKSTIVKLLTKLYDGYDGKIRVDDHDISRLEPSLLRQQIVIVPQDIILFEGSVEFNIGLGTENVTLDDVKEAARAVGADEFINTLPEGYEFMIKEQGSNLSHGQRQLIAFARALAKKPKIIVLDEATSAVDPASEQIIQRGIERLLAGHTVIVIAHRLSTISSCDRILVIERGHLVESGSHQELLRNHQGTYYRLHHSQFAASAAGLR